MHGTIRAPTSESGLTRIALDPHLRLSMSDAKELLSMLQRTPGGAGMTMHWQADTQSPEVRVQAQPEHFDHAVEKLLNEVGGFGPLGRTVAEDPEGVAHVAGRVLVLTPDEGIREVVVAFLSVMGFEPQSASTGAEAINCLRTEEHDLLVVGTAGLGDMSIADFLHAVRHYVEMTTPVVFWTGGEPTELQDVAADLATPLRVLNKPNDFQGFRRAIAEALEWRHMLRLRRRVRRYIAEEVGRRVRRIEVDLFGEDWRGEAPESDADLARRAIEDTPIAFSTSGSAST